MLLNNYIRGNEKNLNIVWCKKKKIKTLENIKLFFFFFVHIRNYLKLIIACAENYKS